MELLQKTFKDSKSEKIKRTCPNCKSPLYNKRVKIDGEIYRAVTKKGITHKAVNFCANPECPFLEQGVILHDGKKERFLGLDEIDDLMFNKTNR